MFTMLCSYIAIAGYIYMFTLLADTGSTDEPILVTSAVAVSVFAMGL